jgi:hypothetical protein
MSASSVSWGSVGLGLAHGRCAQGCIDICPIHAAIHHTWQTANMCTRPATTHNLNTFAIYTVLWPMYFVFQLYTDYSSHMERAHLFGLAHAPRTASR